MNERAQIVRENENVNTVEKFTSTSIIAAQKNGLSLFTLFFFPLFICHYGHGWSIRLLLLRNYWRRTINFRAEPEKSRSIKFVKIHSLFGRAASAGGSRTCETNLGTRFNRKEEIPADRSGTVTRYGSRGRSMGSTGWSTGLLWLILIESSFGL